jgi:hypothetical protein
MLINMLSIYLYNMGAPHQLWRELSLNKKADGVLGMIKAIGTSNMDQ